MPPWSLQNSQNWLIFSHVKKKCQNKIFFLCRATSTAWATHKNSEKNQYFMYRGTWIWRKIKIPCTGYMDLKKKQNIMYPGTWIWRKNKIPCTGVHEILISFTILMCSSGGGGPGFYFFIFLAISFNMLNFFSIFGILKRSRWQNLS